VNDNGFIVVRNPLIRHQLWLKYGGYFVDLVRYAFFKEGSPPFKGTTVHLDKGQCLVPLRFLAKRWSMPKSTVDRLLRRFAKGGLIRREVIPIPGTDDGTNRGTRVTIINYEDYQLLSEEARSGWDADWNANQSIEEGTMNKEAAAPVASDHDCSPTPPIGGTGPQDTELPRRAINAIHMRFASKALEWTPGEVSELAGVCATMQLSSVLEAVERVASRQAKKGKPAKRPAYYLRVLIDEKATPAATVHAPRMRGLTSGIGDMPAQRPSSHEVYLPETEPEPELGEGYEGFKGFFKKE